ncbi:MAG: protein kinase [Acidobacteriia bacterium]|nr:protein kinase [Terriglobia bacterium]
MDNVGSLEGKYEVLEKLHEGGMGAIYKVRHRLLDEIRVIKVMRPQHEANEALRARFIREAQMAVKLRHPNIAQMYDFAFDEAGRGFIVMEYVEGISVQQMLERVGAPPLGLSLEVTRQTLTALGFLHRKGIVHRDISPDNVMVARDDMGRPVVKLIDLGIAKVVTSTTGLTVSGTFLGKLLYASPEQFGSPGAKVDQRSDIYSLGVVLYQLFTGNHPFPGTSPQELIAGHLVKPPLDFATGDPTGRVPEDLRQIVLTAMAKKPEERFPSADVLDQALAAVQTRFPLDPEDFARVMRTPESLPTVRIRIPVPGSTQERIDAQFGMASTPQPASRAESQDARSTAPTLLFPANDAAVSSTMPKRESIAATLPPHATQPTLILPEDTAKPPVKAAGAEAHQGAPVPAAPAAATTPAPTPKPPAKKKAPWLPLAAGVGAVVIAVAFIVGKGILEPKTRPAATPLPAQTVPTPQASSAAEPTAPATPQAEGPAKTQVTQVDFEKAISAGSVERLRTLLAGLSDTERAAIEAAPGGSQRLALARRSVETDAALGKAIKAKDWVTAVQHAEVLVTLLPSSRPAQQARDTAASALEAEVEAFVHEGQTEAALAKLQALQRAWPERAGLAARLAGLHAAREADQRLAATLAAAEAAEKERRPEKGLEALVQATPDARWQERFAAARLRLESLLAELDKAPPVVRLKPGSKMDYSKGKPYTLSLVVTDDYRVKSVTVMARREGAPTYQELVARNAGGDEYTVEITPEFHGNKTVEVYVVAMDYAGHPSRLGSPDQPLRFKKRWLF